MCAGDSVVNRGSFSNKKETKHDSCRELSQTEEGRKYLYNNRCRYCQHLGRCSYL